MNLNMPETHFPSEARVPSEFEENLASKDIAGKSSEMKDEFGHHRTIPWVCIVLIELCVIAVASALVLASGDDDPNGVWPWSAQEKLSLFLLPLLVIFAAGAILYSIATTIGIVRHRSHARGVVDPKHERQLKSTFKKHAGQWALVTTATCESVFILFWIVIVVLFLFDV